MSIKIPHRSSIQRAACQWLVCALLLWSPIGMSAEADWAQIADGFTTASFLRKPGIIERNDVFRDMNGWEILVVKIVVTQAVKFTPDEFCRPALFSLTFFGYGAALWNIAVISGVSGWYGLPVVIVLMIWRWDPWWTDAQSTCANPWGGFAPPPTFTAPVPASFGDSFNGR